MTQRASIKDVAAAAGVSYKTVSRVVNGVSTVDEALRDRVDAAIRALHYVPNTMARSLKTGSGSAVGVVVDSIDDVFFAAVASAVEDRAISHGLGVVIGSTGHDRDREREQLLRMTGQNVRGVILSPVAEQVDYFEPYRASVPLVAIDRPLPGYDSVSVDDYAAAERLVELLVSVGHRRIGLIGWDPSFITARRRRRAYEDVLTRHALEPEDALVPELAFEGPAAIAALDSILALRDAPTALFLSNARHAAAVVARLHELDRTDMSVVSFGDFLLAGVVQPSITCVDQDPYEIGSSAFERLLDLMEAPSAPEDRLMPTSLVLRASHLPTIQPILDEEHAA